MGRVIMSGIVPTLKAPVTGVLASSLAVGSTMKLMEGGTAVEYLVVNQGIPSNSSLYDASCDGTWLLRKDVHSKRQWNSSNISTYASSDINTWLNGGFFNSLGNVERAVVKQVKIPYCVGGGNTTINSGTNGLNTKAFLLGGHEVGWTSSSSSPLDGTILFYFSSGLGDTAKSKRIAYLDGAVTEWWLRSWQTITDSTIWVVNSDGGIGGGPASNSYGIRPALILPNNAVFDETTKLLKGVK